MDLSLEMMRYVTTGQCPYCHVVILSPAHMSQHREQLKAVASQVYNTLERGAEAASSFDDDPNLGFFQKLKLIRLAGSSFITAWNGNNPILAPSAAENTATILADGTMECSTCRETWPIGTRSIPYDSDSLTALTQPSLPSATPGTVPAVDLSGCEVLGVKNEKPVEVFIEEVRKKYRNNSSSTVTKEISISSSITRAVTTDSSRIKSNDMSAGVNIAGFATIQGHVQRQLSERYSATLQDTLSVSETTSVTIPPNSTIEHVIRWKLVSWAGTALLGKLTESRPQTLAQIPYEVPFRLTYEDDFFDIRG